MSKQSQHERDNRANQLNRNNDAYWQSRGEPGRPDDWDDAEESAPQQTPSKPSR